MAVVGAGELHDEVAARHRRARRIALIDASVPELTIRSISTETKRSTTSPGELHFALGRSAVARPRRAASVTAATTLG